MRIGAMTFTECFLGPLREIFSDVNLVCVLRRTWFFLALNFKVLAVLLTRTEPMTTWLSQVPYH